MKARLIASTLHWRHNRHDSVSNHQPHDCLLNRLFRRRLKKTSKLRVTGLCTGNSPGTGEFPSQMASNAKNVSIWWRHHETLFLRTSYFSVCLIWNDYINSCPRSNVWKPGWKQADTCKMFTLFVFSPIYAWKITPLSWFHEFAPTFEKIPLSLRKWVRAWYTFWTGGGGCVCVCWYSCNTDQECGRNCLR